MKKITRAAASVAASCALVAGGGALTAGEADAAPRYNQYFPALSMGTAPGGVQWQGVLLNRSQTRTAIDLGLVGPETVAYMRLPNSGASGCVVMVHVPSLGTYGAQLTVTRAAAKALNKPEWHYWSTKNFRCDNSDAQPYQRPDRNRRPNSGVGGR